MNKFKKFIFALLMITPIFNLFACKSYNENYNDYQPTQGSIFICVEKYEDPYLGDIKILVDKKTRIMYMYYWENSNNDYGVSGITILYDSDGKPKKYNGVITD